MLLSGVIIGGNGEESGDLVHVGVCIGVSIGVGLADKMFLIF